MAEEQEQGAEAGAVEGVRDDAGAQEQQSVKADAAKVSEAKAEEKASDDGKKGDTDKPKPVELTAPQGAETFKEDISAFAGFANEIGLTQEQAEKLVARQVELVNGKAAEMAEAVKGWEKAAREDKEIGGDAFDENAGIARKALEVYGGDDLKQLLDDSGLGSHPAVIRAFWKVGQTIQDTAVERGTAARGDAPRDHATVLYRSSKG